MATPKRCLQRTRRTGSRGVIRRYLKKYSTQAGQKQAADGRAASIVDRLLRRAADTATQQP